ncbi:MAG: histidine kinase dimerization/phospho-acceptor domain-containing protein [Candidatus Limnocylindria bacterium]
MKSTADDPEDDFYETVVCELRQPLTNINGGVQLARRLLETDASRAREALDQVVTQIARMNLMLVELRDRARDAAHVEALFKR